jgi:hypothetical protein
MTTMSYWAFSHLGNKRLSCSCKCKKSSKWKEHKEPERFAKMHFHSGWLLLQDCFARDEDITESIEWLIAGKGFSRSYDLAPRPTPSPPPLTSISSTCDAIHRKTEKERQLADGRRREGGRRGAESYDRKKAWSSVNNSTLFGIFSLNKRWPNTVNVCTICTSTLLGTQGVLRIETQDSYIIQQRTSINSMAHMYNCPAV